MRAGLLLFSIGLFKRGQLVRFIPVSIVIGFTNGIAVLFGPSQVTDALALSIDKAPADWVALLRRGQQAVVTDGSCAVCRRGIARRRDPRLRGGAA